MFQPFRNHGCHGCSLAYIVVFPFSLALSGSLCIVGHTRGFYGNRGNRGPKAETLTKKNTNEPITKITVFMRHRTPFKSQRTHFHATCLARWRAVKIFMCLKIQTLTRKKTKNHKDHENHAEITQRMFQHENHENQVEKSRRSRRNPAKSAPTRKSRKPCLKSRQWR